MKKFYLTGVILMIGLVSFGQSAPKKVSLKQTGERITKAPRIDIESQRTGGGAIWSDDFSDPSTWETGFDATACTLEWEIGQNLGCGGFATIDTIQSTTAFNGYAMIDSDEYGGENGGTEVEDSWFTTASSIDLSGIPAVVLEFETQYYSWTSEKCYVVTSTNNTDWPELTPTTDITMMPNVYEVWPGMETQGNVDNPTLKRINISQSAGDQATVWVRFHWTGTWGYAWFVDDVKILPQPAADIEMQAAYVSHNGTGYEYGRIPNSQTGQDILVGSTVYNFGAENAENLAWTADFTGPTPFSVSGSLAVLESDSTVDMEDMSINSALSPGMYTGTFSVESDADNASGTEFGNNGGMREFMVTDNDVYSIDGIDVYTNPTLGALGTNSFTDAEEGFMMFAYYDIVGDASIEGIEIQLAASSVGGATLQVALHDTADINADNVVDPLEQSDVVTVTQADIDAGVLYVPFSEPFELSDNAYYAGVEMFGDSLNIIRILDDETVPQPFFASRIYIPNDQVYTNGNAVGIRLRGVIGESVGIEEQGDLANMTISPNPSTGLVSVKVNLEGASTLDIKVVSIDGATVAAVSTDRVSGVYKQNLDLSNLANGVYFVKVTTEAGLRTEKIMIAK
jgi:hypothetical protein